MSSRRIGGQNPCRASCYAPVFLKQTVEFNRPPCSSSCFALVFLKQTVEFNRSFQKDRGKTASTAKILYPNPTQQPLPCLLIKSFFSGARICLLSLSLTSHSEKLVFMKVMFEIKKTVNAFYDQRINGQ